MILRRLGQPMHFSSKDTLYTLSFSFFLSSEAAATVAIDKVSICKYGTYMCRQWQASLVPTKTKVNDGKISIFCPQVIHCLVRHGDLAPRYSLALWPWPLWPPGIL